MKQKILLFSLLILCTFTLSGCYSEIVDSQINEPISISGDLEYYANFNEESLIEMCEEKHIEITGPVSSTGYTLFYIGSINTDNIRFSCDFSEYSDDLDKIEVGDIITAHGVCTSIIGDTIYLEGCQLSKPSDSLNQDSNSKNNDTELTQSTPIENSDSSNESVVENRVCVPVDSSPFEDYKTVVSKFKKAGFTNVKAKASYELSPGIFGGDSLWLGDVKKISIDEKTEFSEGDKFEKNAAIVVYYKEYSYKNPDIKYKSYTVAKLIDDAENNELTAEEKYYGKYVAVKGCVSGIDDDGSFVLYPSNDSYAIFGVHCNLILDDQKADVKKLSKGKIITVKGKITNVSDFGYTMDVYFIVK